jgi:S-adenosylmethionine:tRNA ribosyltransferase-isomerase
MIAANRAVQRPASARLLVIDAAGRVTQSPRARWLDFLERGDLVVANDAATLPASLAGVHARTGQPIEMRLAAWRSPVSGETAAFDAIVFGSGDYRTRTEDRPSPPELASGDEFVFGTLTATVVELLDHPRLVRVHFDGSGAAFRQHLAARGRPIQYAHVREPLELWDAWTSIAAVPVAFEPPSAGFVIAWRDVESMRGRGIGFATLTHAAGLSSTGDAALDRRLPLDEWYRIPATTAAAIAKACAERMRVVAIGTTVVRAIEHAASQPGGVRAAERQATQRIDAQTPLRIVDALVTGTHEPGSSHHELLRAFASDTVLDAAARTLDRDGYRTHEFGDSMLVFADGRAKSRHAVQACANPLVARSSREASPVSIATNRRAAAGSRLAMLAAAEYVVVSSNGAGSDPTSVTPGV